MWTNVESSTLVSSMLFHPNYPMYVRASWRITHMTDATLWRRRIYVERQGCLKRVLIRGPEVRPSLKEEKKIRFVLILGLVFSVQAQDRLRKLSNGDADHVFGFDGAYNALASGRMLRYFVNTPLCVQESGPDYPEFATPFGNTVDAYRMFNDHKLSPIPYLMLYDTKLTWNTTGRLVQLVREMKIWQNGNMDLVTSVYHPGFVDLCFKYSHKCELSTSNTSGAVDLFTESQEPTRLTSFQELIYALQMGEIVHFSSMIFLCQGSEPHPFEILGGTIRDFDSYEEGGGQVITSTVQVTASYDKDDNQDYANIVNLRVYDNTLVVVSLTEATGVDMELKSQIEYNCEFQTDMPGGSAVFYRA